MSGDFILSMSARTRQAERVLEELEVENNGESEIYCQWRVGLILTEIPAAASQLESS